VTRRLFQTAVAFSTLTLWLPALRGAGQQTPPVEPKIQEPPLPPAVELPAPESWPEGVPDQPLTADEAAQIALRHQPAIRAAQAGVEQARGRRRQASSNLLPTLSLGATHVEGSTGATSTGLPGLSATGYQTSVTLRQLVFDFNHVREAVRQAEHLERAAQANLTRAQSDLVLQVKQAFYAYSQDLRLVAVNEANLRNQQDHLAVAQARLKAGLGLPSDVVRAETAVSEAIFALNLARNTGSVARVYLAQLMGIDPRTPVQIADTGEPAQAAEDVNALIDQAQRRRPEIAQAEAALEAARHGIRAARTSSAPALSASAGITHRGADFPPETRSSSVGVSISWDPFDGGFTAGLVAEAKASMESAQSQMDSVRLAVVSDVSQAYLDLVTAEQRVATADAEVANAQEALRLAEGRYRSGAGTFIDVLDAQSAAVTAGTNRVNARYAVDQARAALAHATNMPAGAPQGGALGVAVRL
jgi:outer membrane protein